MLPTDPAARKDIPIYSGFIKYFPLAIAEVAALSKKGNDQHNPGKPLHWDRSKSGDELDAMMRHLTDMAGGTEEDSDGVLHATKVAWRAMANLQKLLETRAEASSDAPQALALCVDCGAGLSHTEFHTVSGETLCFPCYDRRFGYAINGIGATVKAPGGDG